MDELEGVVETAIYSDDLNAAEAFYRDVMGLAVIGREEGRHVFFRVGARNVLLIFDPKTTSKSGTLPPHGATGPVHFALGVRAGGLDGWRKRLTERGVAIEQEVQWRRGGRSIYFRD